VGPRADLWALGVVLHEMVTGARPFGGGDEIGVAHAIVYDSPPRASTLLDEVPPALDDVIARCLRKEPSERFDSAEELAKALDGIRLDRGPTYLRKLRRARARLARHRRQVAFASVAMVSLLAAAGVELARRASTATLAPVSLAVLPFDRVGDSAATQHLAVGLSDAIGTDLSRLSRLIVPGYTTTSVYRGDSVSMKQIAAEQRVGAVLRGSVQRVGDRVRVDAQLLDTVHAQPTWARHFERPESELAALERDLVWAVVSSLGVHPTGEERALLDHPATSDSRAYDLFLQGREVELAGRSRDIFRPVPVANIRAAQALYSRSRDADPDFAAARARLALMHMLAATTYDTTAARRAQARLEAEAALRLEPRLPEPHEALASSWVMEGDVPKAIAELRRALVLAPNRVDPHDALANILMEAGRYEDAAAQWDSATRLEPGNPWAAFAAATTHGRLRRREIAMREFNRAMVLAPGDYMIRVIRGHAYLRWTGVPDTLAATMRTVPEEWDPMGMATYGRFTASWAQRRYAEGLAALDRSRSELSRDLLTYEPKPLMRAQLLEALGQREAALASYRSARTVILDSVAANPTNPNMRIALGMAYAGLGDTTDAVREARRAMELEPIARRTDEAMAVMRGAVEVFAKIGEKDETFELLELLFSMPAGREVTVPFLRVWPAFDPLRSDPRFEELLARFAVPPLNDAPGGRR
jgi:TolB-like protein/Flp pilus assembly protein TadD